MLGLTAAVPAQAATAWRTVTPPPLKPSNALLDVSATGPSDAWAVGYQDDVYGRVSPHPYALLRWDGRTWSQRQLPENSLTMSSISAASPDNVWTGGTDNTQSAYAAHWNGSAWQAFRPFGILGGQIVSDVEARGGNALLAGGDSHALLAEWNGTDFTEITVPGTDTWYGGLNAVTRATDGSAFAVGSWNVDDAGYPEPLVLQRTDGSWKVAALPKIPTARLLDVWARSATDAWAVGSTDYDGVPKPLLMHWDGSTWQRVTTALTTGTLSSVAGDATGTVWVGAYDYPKSLFLRYRAGKWTTVQGPPSPYLSAIANIPGTSSFWAVGQDSDTAGSIFSVIERKD
ncbi:hypothetical protein AFR_22925 [Actinoplanes friuliensis DSM 7358]|uniref:Uncharacterized protein n=1 Tax=Actinoplanes friuliensis DSM 7358 TaxID=1246995 RepID=U5W4D7_9ACTN|nr:hypothetical protein AFR_22925 [Actinoplanes friuliensis DSM 7358]